MQAHLSGKSHKKKTKQINRFACDLCLIEVSSQETLQTHYQGTNLISRFAYVDMYYLYDESKVTVYQISLILIIGMTHIKRAKVAEEAKKEAENPMKGNFYYLYLIIYLKSNTVLIIFHLSLLHTPSSFRNVR